MSNHDTTKLPDEKLESANRLSRTATGPDGSGTLKGSRQENRLMDCDRCGGSVKWDAHVTFWAVILEERP